MKEENGMQCTREGLAVGSAPPQQPWAQLCAGHAAVGRDWASGKAMFPSWMQMAAITWVLMTLLNKRLGCDFALLLPGAVVLQGRGLWVSQCTMDIAMALCFLNTELKGALYHVLLFWLQHRAGAWLLAGGSTEPSGVEERISLLRKCKLLMGWIGWEKKMERVWCRYWIIGDKTGSRMTAQDGGRFFLPSRTLPLATGLFPTPLQRRLAPLFSPWNICFYKNGESTEGAPHFHGMHIVPSACIAKPPNAPLCAGQSAPHYTKNLIYDARQEQRLICKYHVSHTRLDRCS